MSSTIFLSSSDFLTYDDLQSHRAMTALRQLSTTNPVMPIKRKSSDSAVVAYLIGKDFLDSRLAVYEGDLAAIFAYRETARDGTYLGRNLSHLVDLLLGHVQAPGLAAVVASEGLSINAFQVFSFEDSKAFYVDDSDDVKFEPDTKRKGTILGYLVHPDHYASLTITPATGSYTGTGDGTIEVLLKPGLSIAETLTFTATSATSFSVSGGDSGALGTLTVGELFDSVGFTALITAGATPFVATDVFTIESLAAAI